MLSDQDPAWGPWVGRTVALPDGTPVIVRMAQRQIAADTLWAVDRRGTMHRLSVYTRVLVHHGVPARHISQLAGPPSPHSAPRGQPLPGRASGAGRRVSIPCHSG